jgi:uncharacterized membrane protein
MNSETVLLTPKRALFALLALLTIVAFFVHNLPMFGPTSPEVAHIAPFRWWLLLHAPFGIAALVLGPLQFSSTIRRKSLQLHRRIGQAYVVAVSIAAVGGVAIGFREEWGVTQPVVQGVVWLIVTMTAWIAARSHNVTQHRIWVARSYGVTFVFVSSRLIPDLFFPTANNWALNDIFWTVLVTGLVLPDLLMTSHTLLTAKKGAR